MTVHNKRVFNFTAVNMRFALFVFAVFSLVVGLRSENEAEWEYRCEPSCEHETQLWGTFKITPASPVGADGWQLAVTFSEPISSLEVWKAKIADRNEDKTEYVLENQDYNAELQANKTFEFKFTVNKTSKKRLQSNEVSFERCPC